MDKIKVMFVCTGNICRSPMAEFVFKDMVKQKGYDLRFIINSSATSDEESGNTIHPGTRRILRERGILEGDHRAVKFTRDDYKNYDYIIYMDSYNLRGLTRIVGSDTDNKFKRLLDFTSYPRDVADPWYTGDFETTFRDISEGLKAFLSYIISNDFRIK